MKIFILFFIVFPLSAATQKFYPVNEVPIELSYLIDSIQDHKYNDEKSEQFVDLIRRLDFIIPHLTKEEMFFLSKSEIYFNILRKNRKGHVIEEDFFSKDTLDTLEKLIEKNSQTFSTYTLWLSKALLSDLKILFESNLFPVYKGLIQDSLPLKSSKMRVFDTKMKMLIPWFKKYTTLSPQELELEIKEIQFEQLSAIVKTGEKLLRFSRFKKLGPIPKDYILKAFTLEKKKAILKEEVNEENLIENLPIPDTPKVEVRKAENWVPKDLFPQPDPNYKGPDKLPKPVDDWIEEL
jgi:hypothetical protein